ncbi:peptidase S1 [Lentibacillus kapialis]|uniref:Peptidase S1 n=1 Tax=Lentibacillus kapialis TaxID=340214 RepID=A0A917UZ13_9BACI|nr:trypsin-like peptidase domain-containing protein [Lentibacillus kapialis]GGJ97942.1 peptidase S1 [Lentibacillus kapialis]
MHKKYLGPLIVSILLVAAGITIVTMIYNTWRSNPISVNNPGINMVESNTRNLDLKSIIHNAEKSVVQIEGKTEQKTITGSGFLFNEKGDIITNAHVVKDADVIDVRTTDGRVYPAAIVGTGKDTDIAVIRVQQLANQNSLTIENDTKAEIGDAVIALGSPHGFQNTVTLGIISGTERNFTVDGFNYENVYQISAQITEGNSGGPLINRETGNVIGINSVGTDDGTIGFSIPADEIYDQVTTWSKKAQNDQLVYKNADEITTTDNTDQLIEDAEYVADYFFESISIRDYVGAYTLLGSPMQSSRSYSEFREDYIHFKNLEYSGLSSTVTDEKQVKTSVTVTTEIKSSDKKKTSKEKITYKLTIGHENDQLKILDIKKS